jgi:hypothetical protein
LEAVFLVIMKEPLFFLASIGVSVGYLEQASSWQKV